PGGGGNARSVAQRPRRRRQRHARDAGDIDHVDLPRHWRHTSITPLAGSVFYKQHRCFLAEVLTRFDGEPTFMETFPKTLGRLDAKRTGPAPPSPGRRMLAGHPTGWPRDLRRSL